MSTLSTLRHPHPSARVGWLPLVVLLAAARCGDDPPAPPPTITEFAATPSEVGVGDKVTLSWATTGATEVRIDLLGGGVVLPPSPSASGQVESAPLSATTTFVLTASNGSTSSTKPVTVPVRGGESAAIVRFTATPPVVGHGQSTTLSWLTTGVVSGVIRAGAATIVHTLLEDEREAGAFEVESLEEETVFVLAVRGADGVEVTAEVTVTPGGPRIVSFVAVPSTILRGESAVLEYSTRNAAELLITGSVSGEVYRGQQGSGRVTVRPTETETFTLVAMDPLGFVSETEVISVNDPEGARILAFYANPSSIVPGASATLSWAVSDAPGGVTVTSGGQVLTTRSELSGTLTVTPGESTEYTLTAFNATLGDATASITVHVGRGVPTIRAFEASPNPAPLDGETVLTWSVEGADEVHILAGASELHVAPDPSADGTLPARLTQPSTTFTLLASNADGQNTATLLVFAHAPPAIVAFTAEPGSFIGSMVVSTISWEVTSASSLELLANGAPVAGFPAVSETIARTRTGSISLVATESVVLELVAASGGGTRRAQAFISQLALEAEPNDAPATATPLTGDGSGVSAAFQVNGDEDFYAVTVPQGGHVSIETSDGMGGCGADTVVELLAPDGVTVVTYNDDAGGTTCSRIDWTREPAARDLPAGTYFIRVAEFDEATGSYTIVVSAGPPACGNGAIERLAPRAESCDDGNGAGGDGCDASCAGEPLGALAGPPAANVFTGAIDAPGQLDFYRLELTSPAYLRAETFAPAAGQCTADTVLRLYDAALAPIAGAEDDDDGSSACSRIDPLGDAFAALPAGVYYLSIEERSSLATITSYALDVQLLAHGCGNGLLEGSETCDDGNTTPGDGCDAGCTIEGLFENEMGGNDAANGGGVILISSDSSFSGAIAPQQDADFYAIDVPQDHHLDVTVTVGSLTDCAQVSPQVELALFAPDGVTQLALNADGGARETCGRLWPYTTLAALQMTAGRYYVRVRELDQDAAVASYWLHVAILAPGCGNSVIESSEQCDDGNTVSGDGCGTSCDLEPDGELMTPVAAPQVFAGAIDPAGDVDAYRIVVTGMSDVYLRAATFAPTVASGTCPAPTDTVLTLYTEDFFPLGGDDDGGVEGCSALDPQDPAARLSPGAYWLFVEEYGGNSVIPAYELLLDALPADVCGNGIIDGGEQCDDGNTAAADGCSAGCTIEIHAVPVAPPGGTAAVNLPTASAFAVVEVQLLLEGQSITATAADAGGTTCDGVDTGLELLDAALSVLGSRSGGGPVGAAGACAAIGTSDAFATDLAAGVYYLRTFAQGPSSGDVELSVAIRDPSCGNGIAEHRAGEGCDDGNLQGGDGCSASCTAEAAAEVEPNDTPLDANDSALVGVGARTVTGVVNRAPPADVDYFSFEVPSGPALALTAQTYSTEGNPSSCNNNNTDTELQLEDSSGNVLATNDDISAGVWCSRIDPTVDADAGALAPGTYFIRVRQSPLAPPRATTYLLDLALE